MCIRDRAEAVHNAVVLEEICKMGLFTRLINPEITQISQAILDKHFLRKHGKNAYYGQKNDAGLTGDACKR